MNVFVCRPYEDELVYSQCTRYMAQLPSTGQDTLVKELFGTALVLSPHMPRNLSTFAERTEIVTGLSKEAIFWLYSMYPFNCSYLSDERRAETADYAYFGTSPRRMPGILSSIAPPKFLRWCPDCVLEDRSRAECGEAYWRRAHQLPGVWQCDKHFADLVDSTVPRFATGAKDVPAEIVIPKEVEEFRRERECSPAEAMLRQRLLGLLNCTEFAPRLERPDYKQAAFQAGFGASGKVDYHALYEVFSDFWGDVLTRADELHRTRVMGVGWLHGYFNARRPIAQPLSRELIEIFFRECGVVINERPAPGSIAERPKPMFYCPSPYAEHGPDTIAAKTMPRVSDPGKIFISCKCGFSGHVRAEFAGKPISMGDVARVSRYGEPWMREYARLRRQGNLASEIAVMMGVTQSNLVYWDRLLKSEANALSPEERAALRSAWLAVLEEIAPQHPKEALQNSRSLYDRIFAGDRSWLQETMAAYRKKHNHPLRMMADWKARDEEYPEELVAAASRLLRMGRVRALTTTGLLKEAGISQSVLRCYARLLPNTIATLSRLTEGNVWKPLRQVAAVH